MVAWRVAAQSPSRVEAVYLELGSLKAERQSHLEDMARLHAQVPHMPLFYLLKVSFPISKAVLDDLHDLHTIKAVLDEGVDILL